jgi:integrase
VGFDSKSNIISRLIPQASDRFEHTFGHLDCPACDRARKLVIAKIVPSLTFAEASELWLSSRSLTPGSGVIQGRFIKENTERSYRAYIDSLNLFFANLRLEQVHLGHFREYQEARLTGSPPFIRKRRPNKNVSAAPCPAGAKKVNQELVVLRKIMRRANCWTQELDEYYEPLLEQVANVPRSLEPSEQKRWLEVALMRKEWWIVYWYSVLAFETSMSTDEMRGLRIGDVNLYHGIVNVREGKNKYRSRTIPIVSADAKWSAEQLLARARDLGAGSPVHYLFPFRAKNAPFDPSRPMTVSGIKRYWNEVRAASGLKWFRQYDTRHTAITRWAEAGVNISEIMGMAGHMTRRMMEHYTHISQQAKRRAMEAVALRKGPQSEQMQPAPFYVSQKQM